MADQESPLKEISEEQPVQPQQRYAGPGSLRQTAPEKRSWPELVGLTTEEAERKIKEEMPNAKVQVIPPDHCVTYDFRLDRVRLFTDSSGKVAREPRLG